MAVYLDKAVSGMTGITGNGGIDYGSADAETKRRIAQSQSRLQNDQAYKQSEISRTLQVIQSRKAQGLDTTDQTNYLNKNLGFQAPMPSNTGMPAANSKAPVGAPAATAATTGTPVTTAANSNTQQGSELMDMMRAYLDKTQTPFNYDAANDPAYQAALTRAKANIAEGNSAAQAEMNRRGILNSTITSDRMGEISSNEMGRVETDVLPQLMQQAYQRYMNEQAQAQQQFANMGALSGMYLGEDQRQFGNRVTEAGLTGNYLPAGAQEAINSILSLKQQAEAQGITAADRAKLSAKADGYRAKLLSLGVDPSQFSAGVNFNTARTVNPGIRTLQGQQLDQQKQQQDWENRFNYGQAIGQFGNGQQTLAAQNQAFNQKLATDQFAYQKFRDSIADNQWKAKFDEDVRQFGLGYALSQLQEKNQQAYRDGQLALGWDGNDLSWIEAENKAANSGTSYSGLSANQVLDAARKQFTVTDTKTPGGGKSYIPSDAATKQNIYEFVADMNLPPGQDDQVLLALGLTAKDIADLDKKHENTSGK